MLASGRAGLATSQTEMQGEPYRTGAAAVAPGAAAEDEMVNPLLEAIVVIIAKIVSPLNRTHRTHIEE
jgi:hypothetical protein